MHLKDLFPNSQSCLVDAFHRLKQNEIDLLENLIIFFHEHKRSTQDLALDYQRIVSDTIEEQKFFRKNKKYRFSSFEEVKKNVYFNSEYMTSYMYGLILTQFLWKNHLEIQRFFSYHFPKDNGLSYVEIGPGHGLFSLLAISTGNLDKAHLIDLSPASLEQTKQLVNHLVSTVIPINFELADFLALHLDTQYDVFVMGEVLEHVEKPQLFLQKIKSLTHLESFIFITTCINAPAIDHIYLFKNFQEIEAMLAQTGFSILNKLLLPHEGRTLDNAIKDNLPINVALILKNI